MLDDRKFKCAEPRDERNRALTRQLPMLRSCLNHLNQLWNVSQRDTIFCARGLHLWRMVIVREGRRAGSGVFNNPDFALPPGVWRFKTLCVKRHLK